MRHSLKIASFRGLFSSDGISSSLQTGYMQPARDVDAERRLLSMNIDDRIKEIRDRLKELEPIVDKQWAAQPRHAPMSDEIAEARKLKLELTGLEHSKPPTRE